MKNKFDLDAKLIPGGGGDFIVTVDGRKIFSRKDEGGRFPEHDEIVEAIQGLH